MKTIINKEIVINVIKNGISVDEKSSYKQLIKQSLEAPPKNGFGLSELRDRISILGKVEIDSDTIVLEDAEFEKLKTCVLASRWGILSQEILNFLTYIETIR